MEKKSKKEIVKMLLNQDLEVENEDDLIDMLADNTVSVFVDDTNKKHLKRSEILADKITEVAGSWSFILLFCLFLIIWIILNLKVFKNVDPYPFILLNLVLSCIAAIQAPIILMSQNRMSKKDSQRGQNDYKTDLKSELILEELHDRLKKVEANQKKILKYFEDKAK